MTEMTKVAAEEAVAAPVRTEIEWPDLLGVASSPHEKSKTRIPHLMYRVLLALLPAFLFGAWHLGPRALLLGAVSVAACILSEFLYQRLLHRPVTVSDGSAAVTGLLLAMNVPVSLPLYMLIIGDVFAIVVVKQIFGGLGKNILNPALAARVFLFSWPVDMTSFATDATTAATPLTAIKVGAEELPSLLDMFLGTVGGCIGEVSTLFLIVGGIYLLARRVISWHIPVAYLGTVAVLAALFPRFGGPLDSVAFEICAGGLILGAFFMATDYTTAPITPRGRLIYGCICGGITVLIRYFGSYPEGVSFAILIANALVYYLDRFTKPRPFGKGGKKA